MAAETARLRINVKAAKSKAGISARREMVTGVIEIASAFWTSRTSRL
jgi:hypothetical protein